MGHSTTQPAGQRHASDVQVSGAVHAPRLNQRTQDARAALLIHRCGRPGEVILVVIPSLSEGKANTMAVGNDSMHKHTAQERKQFTQRPSQHRSAHWLKAKQAEAPHVSARLGTPHEGVSKAQIKKLRSPQASEDLGPNRARDGAKESHLRVVLIRLRPIHRQSNRAVPSPPCTWTNWQPTGVELPERLARSKG